MTADDEPPKTTNSTGTVEEPPPPQEIFHLDLHAWIEAQQTSHGVRHDDYAQYHGYCTRRLSRISHLPDAKKFLVSSSKYATTTTRTSTSTSGKGKGGGGGRHAFCSRHVDTLSVDNVDQTHVPHINILWYLLVLSERSWAHANQLSKDNKGKKKNRQQVLKKLKRATEWANRLLTKAQVSCDASTIQECQAYASWMAANYALEQLDYAAASQEYAKAMTLCHQLSSPDNNNMVGDEDVAKRLERQDLFLTRADTVLRPLFRYCQYELKQAGQPLLVQEPRLLASSSSSQQQQQQQQDDENAIVFRGRELVLESKELRVLLLKLQSLQKERAVSRTTTNRDESKQGEEEEEAPYQDDDDDETSFLNILSVLDDALEVVQVQLSTLEQAQATGPAIKAKRQQYLLWKGYLQWVKTQRVMEHTSSLLRSISGHAERVHVYDALLQHAKSLLQLPRPEEDEEEDDEFALQAQANILRLRALKTYHMAWYYFQELRNCQAAWALLEQSTKLCKRAKEEIAACDEDMPHSEDYINQLDALPMESARAAIRAAWYLQGSGHAGGAQTPRRRATKRPLMLRLSDNDAGTVLAGELSAMPIPCKPVFYDLALHYTMDTTNSVDPIQAYVDEHTVSAEPEPIETTTSGGKGLLGWLTG